MDSRHVREFAMLAETRNYHEAAKLLFISQSSLSKHIKALEAEVGTPLFDRTTRSVRLNAAGRIFLEYARRAVTLEASVLARVRALGTTESHSLTIGSIPVMAPYGITDAIAAFKREHADFTVTIIEGDTAELKELLRTDRCEVAFIRDDGSTPEPDLSALPFAQDTLAVVLPLGHRLARRERVRLEDLAHEEFMLLPEGSRVRALSLDACRAAGFEPRVVFSGQRAENILDLAARGMGVGLLMGRAARRLDAGGVAIIPVEPVVTTQVRIYRRAERQPSAVAQHFLTSAMSGTLGHD